MPVDALKVGHRSAWLLWKACYDSTTFPNSMSSPELPPLSEAISRADYLRLARELGDVVGERIQVGLLASFTADFLQPCVVVEGARRQLAMDLWLAPFGQIEQQAVDEGSLLYASPRDVIVVLARLEDWVPELGSRFLAHSGEALEALRTGLRQRLDALLKTLRTKSKAKVLVGNFAPPLWCAAGVAEVSLSLSQSGFVQRLNEDLAEVCAAMPDVQVLDVARAACETGLDRWRDERLEYLAKAPWSADACVAVAKAVARRVRPWFAAPKKCLVLDMDNTLWGGVLGEAGLEGIGLGPDYPGNVFVDFQRRVLALRDTGILLAAASKNNVADVEEVLASHPACLLKREHFAAFEVHWEDKATSLRRIATTLNIGLDALVFFDDNPVERQWVAEQLPMVTVLPVPKSPMGYARTLADCGCFDLLALTSEDRKRAALYQEDTGRQALQQQAGSLEEFLTGLNMTLTVGKVDESTLPRVAQLLGKTNQFNLTTRRHGEAELQQMMANGAIALWARVQDRFGDSGLIAAAVVVPEVDHVWRIDTFLMSCRVIGRGVETALLAMLEKLLHERGATLLVGEFIPSSKNQPAADFLAKHGFVQANDQRWHLQLDAPRAVPPYFALESTVES